MQTAKQNCKRNIFLYNKEGQLMTYVDLNEKGDATNYLSLSGNVLTRFHISSVKEKNKIYTDIDKTKIVYDEDCKLFHMFFDADDSYCRAVKKSSNRIEPPNIVSITHLHNEDNIESFTVKPNLVQDWVKKL